jgi:hypothetical protein
VWALSDVANKLAYYLSILVILVPPLAAPTIQYVAGFVSAIVVLPRWNVLYASRPLYENRLLGLRSRTHDYRDALCYVQHGSYANDHGWSRTTERCYRVDTDLYVIPANIPTPYEKCCYVIPCARLYLMNMHHDQSQTTSGYLGVLRRSWSIALLGMVHWLNDGIVSHRITRVTSTCWFASAEWVDL